MGYLHINNLYKDQTILMFKECYALEKIHGTSAHIKWDAEQQKVFFFSGGADHLEFSSLFNIELLQSTFSELFFTYNVIIFGEAYGGKQQGMSATYGKELKFIGFDVCIGGLWLNVPKAHEICKSFNIEFVDYVKVSTDLNELNAEREKYSTQAIKNGCGNDKDREGIVLRPLMELRMNNNARVIAKHKNDKFRETKTPHEISLEKFKVLENAKAIAEEWVTEMRLKHVLDKLPKEINIESTKLVISAMIQDIYREAEGEILKSKQVIKSIGNITAQMFKKHLENKMMNSYEK